MEPTSDQRLTDGPVPIRGADQLEVLRSILLRPQREALDSLRLRLVESDEAISELRRTTSRLDDSLADPERRAALVGDVLSEAITYRTKTDRRELARSLTPSVEEAIQESVDANPGFLAGTLFPVIMPAVRRAITAALEQLVDRVNRTIEHRFSLQSLKWRIEAARAGVAYPEYLLAKTLEYRVEQVFLIHRPSGILLLHVASDPRTARDADLIGSMLTAIQDFVHDSFGVPDDEAVESMEVGSLKVWIERSAHTALAAVIRGAPPRELRDQLQETNEMILVRHFRELAEFEGDAEAFQEDAPLVQRCLRSQYKDLRGEETSSRSEATRRLALPAAALLLALLVLVPLFFYARTSRRWNGYLSDLRRQTGIVVAESRRLHVSGLRDPLAPDPVELLAAHGLDSVQVTSRWQPFRSLEPSLEARRAVRALQAPDEVEVRTEGNVLHLAGEADPGWILQAQTVMRAFPSLDVDSSALRAGLTDDMQIRRGRIEGFALRFREGLAQPAPGQEAALQRLLDDVQVLGRALQGINRRLELVISGHASEEGSDAINEAISLSRAERVRSLLMATELDTTVVRLTTVGAGASRPVSTGDARTDRVASRRVTLSTRIH